ncbi:hypothetical protein EGW08_023265 [Elysia chlorotica]|uniref:Integrase catalytic domain-containing protein n=1 Tax=Elysia chlorotica TaxID=188477 RepID=A0A3S0Z824_ELYCH|nr:hypothetical protein EGW08_023265 [Elysia chlorotica]
MSVAHDSIAGGHQGIRKTKDKVITSFYWLGVEGEVARYCRSCDVCQKTTNKGAIPKAPLQNIPVVDVPFKRVAVDLVGPIDPTSEDGHRYILTLVDYATRYPEAVPLKRIDAETVAEALVNIYSRLGVPEEILTDQGTQFMSACMREDGERTDAYTEAAVDQGHRRGRSQVQLPIRLERLERTWEMAQKELKKAQGRQKRYYDRGTKARKFKPGDDVLVLLPTDTKDTEDNIGQVQVGASSLPPEFYGADERPLTCGLCISSAGVAVFEEDPECGNQSTDEMAELCP